MAESRDSV
jgi:hypothetical protein